MGITEQLNNLIVRFRLDEAFPHFQKYLTALELIKKLKYLYREEKKVTIMGTDEVDILYFKDDLAFDTEVATHLVNVNALHKLTRESIDEGSIVILISYDFNTEIGSALSALGIRYIDLYDYFIEHGLSLERKYYEVFLYPKWDEKSGASTQSYLYLDLKYVTFYQLKKYQSASSTLVKQTLLRKVIFQFLWMKDFIGAGKYISEYILAGYEGYERYSDFMVELGKLLSEIKKLISERGSKDTLIFCLDAIAYDTQDDLPFLKRIQNTSLVFENMFTVTPYTDPTFRTLFCKKMDIDDKSYKMGGIDDINSPLIQYFCRQNLKFLYIGSMYRLFGEKYRSSSIKNLNDTASLMFWITLEQLLSDKHPRVLLIHEKNESHPLYKCADFDGERFVRKGLQKVRAEERAFQKHAAFHSLDKQLEFYMNLFPQQCMKIFMSDHGLEGSERFHTIFQVMGERIPPHRERRLYSYMNFNELMQCLLEGRIEDVNECACSYARIQGVDFCNCYGILRKIEARNIDSLISYHGVVTIDSQYIRDRMGNESLHLFQPVSRERGEELINLSKELCRSSYIDVMEDEKFQYSRYLYQIHDRYFARTGAFEEIKRMTVETVIPPDEEAVWALRPGNESAVRLLLRLSPKQRSRIHYVIDINSDCAAGKLGYQVLSPDEVKNHHIDKILIHSFRGHSFFKAEHLVTEAQIIDLYDCLEQRGAVCSSDFYRYEFNASDFDVDYPVKF